MTTYTVVNFLPWRRARFIRHLQRWGLAVCSLWLVSGAAVWASYAHWGAQGSVYRLLAEGERQTQLQLSLRERQLSERAEQQKRHAQRLASRRETQGWAQRLTELAARLPASAWLTALSYRDGVLSLSGAVAQSGALAQLDSGLQALPGFQRAEAGNIQRDSHGRWLFQYQLRREVTREAP